MKSAELFFCSVTSLLGCLNLALERRASLLYSRLPDMTHLTRSGRLRNLGLSAIEWEFFLLRVFDTSDLSRRHLGPHVLIMWNDYLEKYSD